MRLLSDQDVYAATVQYRRKLGLDVATAAEKGMSRFEDAELLRIAQAEGRVFLTRDRDFGGLVFVRSLVRASCTSGCFPRRWQAVHAELGVSSRSKRSGTPRPVRGR